jgi:hypothetical protein
MTYDGQPTSALIARGTDPWVEVDGVPVAWTVEAGPVLLPSPVSHGDCDTCTYSPVPGALEAMNSNEGIQACGSCARFDTDLDAALALARAVGGVACFYTEKIQQQS